MIFAAKNHRFGEKTATFAKKLANFLKNAKFDENFEIRERCKGVHCVDLGESFPTSIFLQNLVSIQLKTSPETSKFDFRITQRCDPAGAPDAPGRPRPPRRGCLSPFRAVAAPASLLDDRASFFSPRTSPALWLLL